jgi:hypothetical protein
MMQSSNLAGCSDQPLLYILTLWRLYGGLRDLISLNEKGVSFKPMFEAVLVARVVGHNARSVVRIIVHYQAAFSLCRMCVCRIMFCSQGKKWSLYDFLYKAIGKAVPA